MPQLEQYYVLFLILGSGAKVENVWHTPTHSRTHTHKHKDTNNVHSHVYGSVNSSTGLVCWALLSWVYNRLYKPLRCGARSCYIQPFLGSYRSSCLVQ